MKKVRYAIGLVGAAPALGLMMPNTVANATTHPPKKAAKSVSLRHSGCTGKTQVGPLFGEGNSGADTLEFWYHDSAGGVSTCIGTVITGWDKSPNGQAASAFRVRVYDGAGVEKWHSSPSIVGFTHDFGVHTSFSRPVQVCGGPRVAGTWRILCKKQPF